MISLVFTPLAIFQIIKMVFSRTVDEADWIYLLLIMIPLAPSWFILFNIVFGNCREARYQRRRQNQCCVRCGYDLRAATTVICPECGAWHGTRAKMRPVREHCE